jgi:hypothetical protein
MVLGLQELEAEVAQLQLKCMDLSPSLAFSGSAGFGTWRIFVPLSISCFTNF